LLCFSFSAINVIDSPWQFFNGDIKGVDMQRAVHAGSAEQHQRLTGNDTEGSDYAL
jgi:hypothetical protein